MRNDARGSNPLLIPALTVLTEQAFAVTTPNEWQVLYFIFGRTAFWGVQWEKISTDHFLHGVVHRATNKLKHPGLGFSEPTLRRAIRALIDKKLVLVQRGRGSEWTSYSLNYDWSLYTFLAENPEYECHQRHLTLSRVTPYPVTGDTTHTNLTLEPNLPITRAVAREGCSSFESVTMAGYDNVIDAMKGVATKSEAARAKKKTKANGSAYETMWKEAQLAAYPTERWFMWKLSDKASVKRAFERGSIPEHDREAFIRYVVTNFVSIRGRRYKWMNMSSDLPTVGFFVSRIREFWEDFEDSRDPNRKIMARVHAAGAAKPQAKEPVATPEALKRLAELEARNAELETTLKAVNQEKAVTRRLKLKRVVKPRDAKPDSEFGVWIDKD